MIYRQGDILLVATADAAEGEPLPRDPVRGVVLAVGESTNHFHRFTDEHVELRDPRTRATRHLTVVKTEARLLHEEHAPITITPGHYDLPQQMEYRPTELRRVAD